jgi:hypothetical protein
MMAPIMTFLRCSKPARGLRDALLGVALLCGVTTMAVAEGSVDALLPQEPELLMDYVEPVETPRRVEVRRALLSDDDLTDVKRERRRLSAEERNALRLELRRAMRNAYETDIEHGGDH